MSTSHDHHAIDLLARGRQSSPPHIHDARDGLHFDLHSLPPLAFPSSPTDPTHGPSTPKIVSQPGAFPGAGAADGRSAMLPPTPPPHVDADPVELGLGLDAASPSGFPLFPNLPAELRLKVWAFSFAPRTVELHTRRTHYADHDRHGGGPTRWMSLSCNPAALSVNVEARAAALEHYTVAVPLAAPLAANQTFERPGDMLGDGDRVLYLNLESDTLVVLGDPPFERLTRLLEWFRQRDEAGRWRSGSNSSCNSHSSCSSGCGCGSGSGSGGGGGGGYRPGAKGLRRLALSAAPWVHAAGGGTLRVFARTVFAQLEEFVMFMYAERVPPSDWRGGKVLLDECGASDYYRRFLMARGMQFREGEGWMRVGRNELRVLDIRFEEGW